MTARNATETATADLIAKQKEYIWPCAATYYEHPLALERGEGMHVWDSEGNRYLDCFGGVLTTSVGHARPEVVQAAGEQIVKIAHTSTLYINQPQADLGDEYDRKRTRAVEAWTFDGSGNRSRSRSLLLSLSVQPQAGKLRDGVRARRRRAYSNFDHRPDRGVHRGADYGRGRVYHSSEGLLQGRD